MANIISYTKAKLDELLGSKVPTSRLVAGQSLLSDVVLSKSDVGLSNVNNTSDASKPISTAAGVAFAQRLPTFVLAPADPDPTTGAPAGLYFRRSS